MLIPGLLATDPDDERMDALAHSLLRVIAASTNSLPDDPIAYDHAVWAQQNLSQAMVYHSITQTRRSRLAATFSGFIGLPIATEALDLELKRQCEEATASLLYASLAAHGPANPRQAAILRSRVYALCRTRLDIDDVARLDAEFLADMLPHLGEEWRSYMSLISRSTLTRDPSVLLPLVEAYAHINNPPLEEFISERLRRHVRGPGRYQADKDTIVNALREQFVPRPRSR
jgi:hypothetical protein